jgi:hypothetical protein
MLEELRAVCTGAQSTRDGAAAVTLSGLEASLLSALTRDPIRHVGDARESELRVERHGLAVMAGRVE